MVATSHERVFIGLGTNLGADLDDNLRHAIEAIRRLQDTELVRVSSFVSTPPWGVTEQPPFLNAVAEIRTQLEPLQLLHALQELERKLGRTPSYRWGPRVIDIDILLYGTRVVDLPELQIPHPHYRQREFVLRPLAEIAPELAANR